MLCKIIKRTFMWTFEYLFILVWENLGFLISLSPLLLHQFRRQLAQVLLWLVLSCSCLSLSSVNSLSPLLCQEAHGPVSLSCIYHCHSSSAMCCSQLSNLSCVLIRAHDFICSLSLSQQHNTVCSVTLLSISVLYIFFPQSEGGGK